MTLNKWRNLLNWSFTNNFFLVWSITKNSQMLFSFIFLIVKHGGLPKIRGKPQCPPISKKAKSKQTHFKLYNPIRPRPVPWLPKNIDSHCFIPFCVGICVLHPFTMSSLFLGSLSKLPRFYSTLKRLSSPMTFFPIRSCSNASGPEKKLPRPEGLGSRATKESDDAKNRGPVSWVNLSVTGVVILSMVIMYSGKSYQLWIFKSFGGSK